jgi:hypothetical protein
MNIISGLVGFYECFYHNFPSFYSTSNLYGFLLGSWLSSSLSLIAFIFYVCYYLVLLIYYMT